VLSSTTLDRLGYLNLMVNTLTWVVDAQVIVLEGSGAAIAPLGAVSTRRILTAVTNEGHLDDGRATGELSGLVSSARVAWSAPVCPIVD
jgi:hypothetical protein